MYLNNKNKILSNLFLIIYPELLLIIMYLNFCLTEYFKYNFSGFLTILYQYMLLYSVYFLVQVLFIYCFFYKKASYSIASVIIGVVQIILFHVPQLIFGVFTKILGAYYISAIYSQIQLNLVIFGTLLGLYIILFINKLSSKKGNLF